jgi:hypothetical protein
MKNLFIQKEKGHCTVFAFANMFRRDLSQFMTEEFRGCNDEEERKIITSIEDDLGIAEVISIRHGYNIPLPNDLLFKILSFQEPVIEGHEEFDLIPYLLSVRRVNTHEYWHSVVVFNHNGQLYYSDSYNEDIIRIEDQDHLSSQFLDCWCVKRLVIKSKEQFARLSSKAIGLELEPCTS